MDYEQTGDKEHPHKLTFNGDEVEVVTAAYREHMYYLALRGNTHSISDYEAYISSWEQDGEPRSLKPIMPVNIIEVLEEFSDRTDEVIQSIPETTGVAAFASDDIGERFRLGKLAVDLAKQIKDKTAPVVPASLEDVDVDTSDETINRWLRND